MELGGLSKSFRNSVEAMVGSLKTSDVVLAFFTKHATEALFQAFAGVFEATKKAVAAVPADYAKYVEQKAVQSLKSTMFNRQTHQNACGLMDSISVANGFLQDWVLSSLIPISLSSVLSNKSPCMPRAGHHQELRPHSDPETARRAEGTRGGCEAAEALYDYSSLCEHDSSQNGF